MDVEILKNPALIWFLIGLTFALLELVIPGLVIVFFAAGAWVVSLVCLFLPIGLDAQIVIFMITSIVSLVIFRKYLKRKFFNESDDGPATLEDEFIGRHAVALSDFVDTQGTIKFKGTQWQAESKDEIKKGQRVEIIQKESIKLIVKPIKKEN